MKVFKLYLLVSVLFANTLVAQVNKYRPTGEQIPGPASAPPMPGWLGEMEGWARERPSEFQDWLSDIQAWRAEYLVRIGYNDAEYRRPELQWARATLLPLKSW